MPKLEFNEEMSEKFSFVLSNIGSKFRVLVICSTSEFTAFIYSSTWKFDISVHKNGDYYLLNKAKKHQNEISTYSGR